LIISLLVTVCLAGQCSLRAEVQLEVTANSRLQALVTLTNTRHETLDLLTWDTPFDTLSAGSAFMVFQDGTSLDYEGIMVYRVNSSADDYVTFGPWETKSIVIDLASVYDVSQAGMYIAALQFFAKDCQVRGEVQASLTYEIAVPQLITSEMASAILTTTVPRNLRSSFSTMPEANTFTNCAAAQQTTINTAWANFGTYARRMQASLPNGQTSAVYRAWFGVYAAARHSQVSTCINRSVQDANGNGHRFYCAAPSCSANVIAYVYPTDSSTIYLCNLYFSLPATGQTSRATTIVHEVAHFRTIGSCQDYAYGATACRNLATSNPGNAVYNSDNFAFYAANV